MNLAQQYPKRLTIVPYMGRKRKYFFRPRVKWPIYILHFPGRFDTMKDKVNRSV